MNTSRALAQMLNDSAEMMNDKVDAKRVKELEKKWSSFKKKGYKYFQAISKEGGVLYEGPDLKKVAQIIAKLDSDGDEWFFAVSKDKEEWETMDVGENEEKY